MSITKAAELMQTQDKIIKSFPEVESVFGKAGRANTATDPAPTEMFETVINLKPQAEWRPGMTTDKLIAEMDKALQFPASPMPGRCRSRPAPTCCPPASARRSASRSSARISDEMEKLAKEIEAVVKPCRAPPVPLPSASPAASTSTSSPTGNSWPATAWPSASCRM
jgi:Cu(I)/Ag(I) efflux system membrane protein CusA/SilA